VPPFGAAWRLPAGQPDQTPNSRSGATQAVSYGLEFGGARLEARADMASTDPREVFGDILTVTPPCGDAPVGHRAGEWRPACQRTTLGGTGRVCCTVREGR
jgi:hypothetical protein